MTVLPQISGGEQLPAGMAIGKFQGVTSPTTPIGSRIALANLSGSSDGTVSPAGGALRRPCSRRCRSPPARRRAPPAAPCPSRASSSRDSSSLCSARMRATLNRISPRFGAGISRPGREGGLRRFDRGVDVGRPAGREVADELVVVGRIDAVEGRAGLGVDPVAADQVAEVDTGCSPRGSRGRGAQIGQVGGGDCTSVRGFPAEAGHWPLSHRDSRSAHWPAQPKNRRARSYPFT